MGPSTVWEFFAWLLLALAVNFFSWWTIGDFTLVYWLPNFKRAGWMIDCRPLMKFWLLAYICSCVSAWMIWRDNGRWEDASGVLTIFMVYLLLAALWHLALFMYHRIQSAFFASVLATGFALVTTVWFFVLGPTPWPGVSMLIVTLWIAYVSAWTWMLGRMSIRGGSIREYGTRSQEFTFQDVNAGLPQPHMWQKAGRRCPYNKPYNRHVQRLQENQQAMAQAEGSIPPVARYTEDTSNSALALSQQRPGAHPSSLYTQQNPAGYYY